MLDCQSLSLDAVFGREARIQMLKMAVLDRQEGVEKSTPTDPLPMGAIRKEIILSEDPYSLTD